MASTIDVQPPQQYVDFDEYIEYQLQKTGGSIKSTDILTAFAFVAVFVLAYLLLFVIGDHWLFADGFSQTTRVVLLSLVGLASAAWISWKVLFPYLRQVNALFAAKLIERSQPELRSTLLNLIDARNAGKELSPAILKAMEKRAALSMSQSNVDEAVDKRPLMWASYAILGLVVLFSFYTILTPKKVSASIWRALFPVSAVEAPKQTVIEKVTPGDAEVIPGTRLEVLADISGDVPEKVILRYSTADREFVDEPIEMREDPDMPKRYRVQIIGTNGEGIQQSLNYSIQAGDDTSARYAVTILQPPAVEIKELHTSYPAYMEREAKTRPTGNIDDYEGAIVTFLAEANMPLKSATITFHDDHGTNFRAEAVPMSAINAERTRFRANWVLSIRAEDGIYPRYYTIECKNDKGEADPKPTRWPIRIHPDQRPEARITSPKESQIERPANAVLPLTAFASDDFKVKSLTLWKQLNDKPPVKHISLFEGAEVSLSVDYDWRLNENWPLKNGDKVSYWVQAEDNRTPEAGKRNSDKHVILIQPDQPEADVQKQLEADRQQQQPKPDEKDPSPKNPENQPPNNQPRPEDAGMENEAPPNQPQENPPPDNQPMENGGGGEASDQNSENGGGNSSENNNGKGGQEVKNDGTQDGKALESLHRHFNKNQTDPGQQNQNTKTENQTPNNPNPMENQTPGSTNNPKPMENQPGQQTPDTTQQPMKEPGDDSKPMPGNNPSQNQEDMGTEPKNTPGNPPMPNPTKNMPNPAPEKTEGPKDGMGQNQPPNTPNPNTPANNKKPGENNNTTPDTTTPNGQEAEGNPGENTGETNPTNSKKPANSKTNSGPGGMETEPSTGGMGRDAEKPLEGTEQPAAPDKNAKSKPATGNETGPATSETDPKTNPKPAKNDLERTDPEKPTATQKREGEPEENVPNTTPKTGTDEKTPKNNATKPSGTKPSEANPEERTPKPSTNPDEGSETMPEETPDKNPNRNVTKPEDKPNVGDDELREKPRPENQEAKKPDGGENGTSKQNKTGTPGGTEQGPGDPTERPGQNDTAKKPTGGKPSQEPGQGTSSRPTEGTEEGPNGDAEPTEAMEPKEGPVSDKPGESPDPSSGPRNPGQPGAKPNPDQAGPPDPNQSLPNDPPVTPEAAEAAEEANLEYGREATDLALKKLENELKRGEVNEKWLKEMGWDKAEAQQFLDRMKDRIADRDQATPEALARQRQFNEWLKRLNKPAGETTRRSGTGIGNETARDLYNPQQSAPPAELKDLYEAYKRGISERTK